MRAYAYATRCIEWGSSAFHARVIDAIFLTFARARQVYRLSAHMGDRFVSIEGFAKILLVRARMRVILKD